MARSISVIINTYNRADSLAKTLKALEWQDHSNFEVLVINGPSTDGTDALLAGYAGRVKIGRCEHRNLSESRNIGIRMAAGEIVAFIDDDAYADPGWLSAIAKAYDRDEVAAAGGPTFDHTGYSLQAQYSRADRFCNAWVDFPPAVNPTEYLAFPQSMQFVYTIGTNSSFRRDRLVGIGGFDEEFVYYADETDACCRLVDAGFVIAALDTGFVYHKFLPSQMRRRNDVVNDWFQVLKSRFYFGLKHGVPATSFADVCTSESQFVDSVRTKVLNDLTAGVLPQEDADKFEKDVREASSLALERFATGISGERAPEWFEEACIPFLPFRTLRPQGDKLHICLIAQEYPPVPVNGIGRVVHSLAKGLASRGHVVRVLTRGTEYHKVDLEDDVWVHRIVTTTHSPSGVLPVPSHIWNHSASLLDELARIDGIRPVDVVQAPNWDSEGIATLLDGRFPLVVALYTPLRTLMRIDLDHRDQTDDPLISQLERLERYTYLHADGFLACGQAVVDEIEHEYGLHLYPSRLGFVAHGLADLATEFDPLPTESGTRILFVGRLEARKGIDILLTSVPRLAERGIDFTLVVLGDDSLVMPDGTTARSAFERRWSDYSDHVEFLGRADDERLLEEYARCDVVVAPSRFESFGLMVVEAMMFGKPVICCNVGGMGEVLVDGVTGLLVPSDNVAALTEALASLAGTAERRREMGRRGRALYEERFSVEAMAAGVETFYYRMLNNWRSSQAPSTALASR